MGRRCDLLAVPVTCACPPGSCSALCLTPCVAIIGGADAHRSARSQCEDAGSCRFTLDDPPPGTLIERVQGEVQRPGRGLDRASSTPGWAGMVVSVPSGCSGVAIWVDWRLDPRWPWSARRSWCCLGRSWLTVMCGQEGPQGPRGRRRDVRPAGRGGSTASPPIKLNRLRTLPSRIATTR